ncbi:MAG: hypothetical protein JNM80_10145 [Phycisphaerae bacterium]|nr:hypothetical protein [Phycisphaerae bacterium]
MSESEVKALLVVVALGGSLIVAVTWIVAGTISKVRRVSAREESRREIAAYVAEGSISPADAKAILEAGESDPIRDKIASGVAWGTIRPKDAENLIRAGQPKA